MTTDTKNETMLQQITDVAWLVQQGPERLGILNKDVQEHFTFIAGDQRLRFDSDSEVLEHFGNASLFDAQLAKPEPDNEFFINGHRVDYSEPFVVTEDHPSYTPNVPLYTKIEGSLVAYAAGHYCIQFEKGWKHSHCPKYSTLTKYGFEGPFRTKIDAKHRMKYLNG